MGDRVIRKISEYLKAHRLKRYWQTVLTSLAAVVVFCTTYALILPAITLEKADADTATASDARGIATPANAPRRHTVSGDDLEEDGDLIFDLDYGLGTRRSLTKGARDLGIDVDMGVPDWMLTEWDDVPDFEGELTGNWSEDLLAVAESQVGYLADYEGKSYYGDRYGKPYEDWDAMFVAYCLEVAEVPEDVIPRETSAAELADRLEETDFVRLVAAEDHTPEAGDLIFLDTDGDGEADRVGIVEEYKEETGELKVIEGDYRTRIERYDMGGDLASRSDAEKATPSDARKKKTGRGGGIGSMATPNDAVKISDPAGSAGTVTETQSLRPVTKTGSLRSVVEKKETILLTAAVEKEEEDDGEDDEDGDGSYNIISEAAVVTYDLETLLAGDESVSVVAYGVDTGILTGTDSDVDLKTYIESVNADGGVASIALNLRTVNDSEISGTESETKVVMTNTEYHLALTVYSSAGFEANTTYTYSLPEGVVVEAATGSITVEDGTVIGTWTVSDDGTVTLAFNDKASEYQDTEITFTATATINTTEKTITIGDTTYTVSENTNLAVNKSGNYSGYTKTDSYYHGRTYEIEFSQSGVSLEGTKVTDYATDTQYSLLYTGGDISYDNQHFDTSIPLVITIVDASGTTVYTWTVDWSDSSLTLYTLDEDKNVVETTSTSDRIIGWQYVFPKTVEGTDSSGNPITVDLTTGDWSPYEIHITSRTIFDVVPSADNVRTTYYNRVEVDNGVDKDKAHTSISQSTGTYSLRKDWTRGEDGVSVDWTISATIPGGTVASYQIGDNMYIDKATDGNYLIFADYTTDYTMTITISEGTTINGTEIAAGTYTVYDINGEVPEDALFVCNYVSSISGITAYFVLGMVCHCYEDCCDGWDDGACQNILYTSPGGTTYCTCWQLDLSAKILLTYTTPKDKMLELLSKYGYSTSKLYNYAELRTGTYNGARPLLNTSVLSNYTANIGLALAAKTLLDAPSSDNDYTASYEVVINTNHNELTENGADLTITDTLSTTLTFLASSLIIQATDASGNITTLTSDDYTYSYNSDTHVITISIKNPGTNSYTITYDAQMLNPNAGATYSNSLALSWQGEDVTVETDTSYLSEVTTTGTTYMVAILKIDETTEAGLEGATFNLCNADGTVKATGTTDENGQVTFKTVSGTTEGSSLTFAVHTLYYLEETYAPEGYTLDETKRYFYFCNVSGDEPCDVCNNMDLPSGVTATRVKDYNVSYRIPNEQATYDFTIKKVDSENSSQILAGAEFYLYYESNVLDAEGKETGEKRQYYAALDDGNAVTGWNSSTEQATMLTVSTDGTVSVSGVPAGTYYLKEITAPDGYNLLKKPIEITVTLTGGIEVVSDDAETTTKDGVVTITVKNTAGRRLPDTGGTGRTPYTMAGMLLISCCACLIYKNTKRERGHES